MFCSQVSDLDFRHVRISNPKTLAAPKGVSI
jgi:hypothetical protein